MESSSTKEKNSEKLLKKFLELRTTALHKGLSDDQLQEALRVPSTEEKGCKSRKTMREKVYNFITNPAHRVHILVALLALSVGSVMVSYEFVMDYVVSTPCLVDNNVITDEVYRPRVNCDMCKDVVSVPEERNISREEFYEKYSFTGRPVLVKGAIANWTAMTHFSFKFFQQLYKKTKGSLTFIEDECQFFPYETEFVTLAEALSMSDARASFQPGEQPWYIGWSNCHKQVGKKLREHYQRPYFLPPDSETVTEDWIFMGGPGRGAGMHLDYVERPSWQAQISGTKTWQLMPSPECEAVCHGFNVTVQKGDIVVLDTNIWYHSTFVHPGEISITIGSEFD